MFMGRIILLPICRLHREQRVDIGYQLRKHQYKNAKEARVYIKRPIKYWRNIGKIEKDPKSSKYSRV